MHIDIYVYICPGCRPPAECSAASPQTPAKVDRFHLETLIAHKLSSRKLPTHNDLYWKGSSKRVEILIETKLINFKCLQMKLVPGIPLVNSG